MHPHRSWLALTVLLCLAGASAAQAQVARVSVSTAGVQANAASLEPDISSDGRFVTFRSAASNLVAGDANGVHDVFVRDRDTDGDGVFDEAGAVSTTLASGSAATPANGASYQPRLSADGRYVAFLSDAINLVPGQALSPGVTRLYRFDRQTGTTILVSMSTAGQSGGPCTAYDMSDDGQVFVMRCDDPPIAPGGLGPGGGIFVRDVAAGTTERISDIQPPPETSPQGTISYFVSSPAISADGQWLAFVELVVVANGTTVVDRRGTATIVDRTTAARMDDVHPALVVRFVPNGSATVAQAVEGTAGSQVLETFKHDRITGARLRASAPLGEVSDVSADGRLLVVPGALYDLEFGRQFALMNGSQALASTAGRLSASGRWLAFGSASASLVPSDTNGAADVFVADLDALFDVDADTLDDRWETFFGLSTSSGTGNNGPTGDPDNDGLTNAAEEAARSHPRGTFRRYLAEGAVGTFFSTRIALANADAANAAAVVLRFEKSDGTSISQAAPVAAQSRTTREPGAAGLGFADFSTVIESDRAITVDRLMQWDATGYGSHAETATVSPATTWFLAEGTTVLGFQLFYLLQNPQPTATTATVRFLLPSGSPVVRTYELAPRSRTTIYVNTVPGLASTDVSGDISATQPIVVERAMYRNRGDQAFTLGHAASGVTQAATSWFLAEGATGSFFDTYVLVANPSAQAASVQIDFLTDDGTTVSRTYQVAAASRFTVFVDSLPGLEATSLGARITSSVPIVVERAMYWAGGFFEYYEGHVSTAVTQTGSRWVLGEGEAGGPLGAETYILLANTGGVAMTVSLRVLPESGTVTAPAPQQMTVPANGRVSVALGTLLGGAPASRSQLAGVEITELGAQPTGALVVEGAIYRNVGTELWGAGASLPATRMP